MHFGKGSCLPKYMPSSFCVSKAKELQHTRPAGQMPHMDVWSNHEKEAFMNVFSTASKLMIGIL